MSASIRRRRRDAANESDALSGAVVVVVLFDHTSVSVDPRKWAVLAPPPQIFDQELPLAFQAHALALRHVGQAADVHRNAPRL